MNCKHSLDFIITRRQLSSVFAGILFLFFFMFIAGYLMHIYIVAQREYVVSYVDLANDDYFKGKKKSLYSAELIAFGTHEKANDFIEDFDKKGVSLVINEHKSCTKEGQGIVWYQVVTDLYEDKNELITLVDQVRLSKQLGDVRFITLEG
jgi:hypothetical protein